jgi:type IV pilus assembly protein PilV
MNHAIFNTAKGHRGFTLLEVLIALLVLSIGLLGLAALQTVGMRSNQMANMRTLATQIAYDMTDRMRANQAGMGITIDNISLALEYDAANDSYLIGTSDTVTDAPPNCDTTICSEQELATYDLASWRAEVARLPGGKSSITGPVAGTGVISHTITVFWDEERKGVTGEDCGPDPDIDLRCIRLTI